jgi:hypothetical protein
MLVYFHLSMMYGFHLICFCFDWSASHSSALFIIIITLLKNYHLCPSHCVFTRQPQNVWMWDVSIFDTLCLSVGNFHSHKKCKQHKQKFNWKLEKVKERGKIEWKISCGCKHVCCLEWKLFAVKWDSSKWEWEVFIVKNLWVRCN